MVNLVRGREYFVGLPMLLVYGLLDCFDCLHLVLPGPKVEECTPVGGGVEPVPEVKILQQHSRLAFQLKMLRTRFDRHKKLQKLKCLKIWWLIGKMWWLIGKMWWLIRKMWWLIGKMWWLIAIVHQAAETACPGLISAFKAFKALIL